MVTGINQRGAVKFVGHTHFADGLWVGIELFSGTFGKNDGSVQDQRYFECAPQHGVFVRPSYCTKEVDSAPGNHAHPAPPPASSPASSASAMSAASSPSASSWRGTWIAAESKSAAVVAAAAVAAAAAAAAAVNQLPGPPRRTKSGEDGVVPDDIGNSSGNGIGNGNRSSPPPMLLPTPRKVTVERMSPSLRTTTSNSFNSLVEEPSDQFLDKLIHSKAFGTKVQQYVQTAVDAAVEQSLKALASDVQRRFESLESLVEAIGAAVTEVCDDADAAAHTTRTPNGSNDSNISNGSVNVSGRSQRRAGETEAMNSPRGSPKQHELTNMLSETAAAGMRRANDGYDVGDPYAEVARLRSALEKVSLLAGEAQEEITLEREELEDTIADLREQLLHAADGGGGGGGLSVRSE